MWDRKTDFMKDVYPVIQQAAIMTDIKYACNITPVSWMPKIQAHV